MIFGVVVQFSRLTRTIIRIIHYYLCGIQTDHNTVALNTNVTLIVLWLYFCGCAPILRLNVPNFRLHFTFHPASMPDFWQVIFEIPDYLIL